MAAIEAHGRIEKFFTYRTAQRCVELDERRLLKVRGIRHVCVEKDVHCQAVTRVRAPTEKMLFASRNHLCTAVTVDEFLVVN